MNKIKIQKVKDLVDKWTDDNPILTGSIDFIVGISRGGLIPASFIATRINKPLVCAYIDKQDNVYFDKSNWIEGKRILIVDDACRTGKTIKKITKLIEDESNPSLIEKYTICSSGEVKDVYYSLEDDGSIILPWDYDRK